MMALLKKLRNRRSEEFLQVLMQMSVSKLTFDSKN